MGWKFEKGDLVRVNWPENEFHGMTGTVVDKWNLLEDGYIVAIGDGDHRGVSFRQNHLEGVD